MIRVSSTIETITLSFDAADPFYAPNAAGVLTAFYVPTPELMAWFAKTLAAAEAARKKLTTNQLRDLERMKSSFASLSESFPPGSTPHGPYGEPAEDFAAVTEFVASSAPALAKRDFAAVSSSYRHPPRRLLAWRPVSAAAAEASRLQGIADRSFMAQKSIAESVPPLKIFREEP